MKQPEDHVTVELPIGECGYTDCLMQGTPHGHDGIGPIRELPDGRLTRTPSIPAKRPATRADYSPLMDLPPIAAQLAERDALAWVVERYAPHSAPASDPHGAWAVAPETPVQDTAGLTPARAREDEPYSRAALQGILLELNDMLRTLNNAVCALECRVIALEHAPKPAAQLAATEYAKPVGPVLGTTPLT